MKLYALERTFPSRRIMSDGIMVRLYHKKADAELEVKSWTPRLKMRVVPVTVKERK